jgi:hypothetical protein
MIFAELVERQEKNKHCSKFNYYAKEIKRIEIIYPCKKSSLKGKKKTNIVLNSIIMQARITCKET